MMWHWTVTQQEVSALAVRRVKFYYLNAQQQQGRRVHDPVWYPVQVRASWLGAFWWPLESSS